MRRLGQDCREAYLPLPELLAQHGPAGRDGVRLWRPLGYPSEQDGLNALLEPPPDAPRWNGAYVKRRDALIDPWGQMYVYRFPGEFGDYDLYSLGADQAEGGEGEDRDITSW